MPDLDRPREALQALAARVPERPLVEAFLAEYDRRAEALAGRDLTDALVTVRRAALGDDVLGRALRVVLADYDGPPPPSPQPPPVPL